MVKIILEVADNGVIKTIVDDNFNGAGEKLEKRKLFEFEDDLEFKTKIKFFFQLAEDLGINTGNNYDKDNLVMGVDWGSKFTPSSEEIMDKIKLKKLQLEVLKEMYKQSKEDNNEDSKES